MKVPNGQVPRVQSTRYQIPTHPDASAKWATNLVVKTEPLLQLVLDLANEAPALALCPRFLLRKVEEEKIATQMNTNAREGQKTSQVNESVANLSIKSAGRFFD